MDKDEIIRELNDLSDSAAQAAEAVENDDIDLAINALAGPIWPDTLTAHLSALRG